MLAEAVNFAATTMISPRRNASEIRGSVRLWARSKRCGRDWAQHEAHCHDVVLSALEGLKQRRIAVVLGSGLLRDVPIETLSKTFREVWLVDLQHLASVRFWVALKGLRNLKFLNRDLSGVAEPQPLSFLAEEAEIDLVISANLLSQIGVGLARANEDSARIPRLLQAHVDGLAALPARSVLLTDTDYEIIGRDGALLERHPLLAGVVLPETQAEWRWTVAPFGELDPQYQAIHRVIAVIKPPEAVPARVFP